MPNKKIKSAMIFAGVSINALADYLRKSEQETVELLDTELDIMQNYRVMLAVAELARRERA